MIHTGDAIEVMAGMPADSVDAVVTDPPYGLEFMGKGWDKFGAEVVDAVAQGGYQDKNGGNAFSRAQVRYHSGARAGQSFQAWCEAWGREALRVTKPGGYLLAFGGTRTHHRLVCGLEDAGWIIRDELDWIYASGFPKGRANLKPAHEPIVLARKPGLLRPLNIEETRIGTTDDLNGGGYGGELRDPDATSYGLKRGIGEFVQPAGRWPSNLLLSDPELFDEPNPYVVGSGATRGDAYRAPSERPRNRGGFRETGRATITSQAPDDYGDSGGYSRFFKVPERSASTVCWCGHVQGSHWVMGGCKVLGCGCQEYGPKTSDSDGPPEPYPQHFIIPKADRADREPVVRPEGHESGKRFSTHPTMKPTDLMRHLVRLVTPSGGTVLDCFAGSGSTILACELEGFPWIAIEKEPEYVRIMRARLNGVQRGLGLDVGAPIHRAGGPTGMEKGHHPDSYQRHSDKGWSGGWADTPDEEPAA